MKAVASQMPPDSWNATERAFPLDRSFRELFEAQAGKTPDSIAVSGEAGAFTYRQLDERANQVANGLTPALTGATPVVAVAMVRSVDTLVAMLALFKIGAAYLPIDPSQPAERVALYLRAADPAAILVDENSAWLPDSESNRPVLRIADFNAEAVSPPRTGRTVRPEHLAYVIFTSGTTGVPKGAMVSHRGMMNHLFAKIEDLRLGASDAIAQTASTSFDISVWQFLAGLLVGGRTAIIPESAIRFPRLLLKSVEQSEATILELVPSALNGLVQEVARAGGERLPAVRCLVATGEALPFTICRRWFDSFPDRELVNAYGPTECSDDVTHYFVPTESEGGEEIVPIGRPIANTKLYVLDDEFREAPIGESGELFVAGAGVGLGYIGQPELTEQKFPVVTLPGHSPTRMYRTGDLTRYDEHGNLHFLGRIDRQIKIHGYRIELEDVEAALYRDDRLAAAAVSARKMGRDESRLIAFYGCKAGYEAPAGELRALLSTILPAYMIPSVFVRLDSFPVLPSGKVDRKALDGIEVTDGGA